LQGFQCGFDRVNRHRLTATQARHLIPDRLAANVTNSAHVQAIDLDEARLLIRGVGVAQVAVADQVVPAQAEKFESS